MAVQPSARQKQVLNRRTPNAAFASYLAALQGKRGGKLGMSQAGGALPVTPGEVTGEQRPARSPDTGSAPQGTGDTASTAAVDGATQTALSGGPAFAGASSVQPPKPDVVMGPGTGPGPIGGAEPGQAPNTYTPPVENPLMTAAAGALGAWGVADGNADYALQPDVFLNLFGSATGADTTNMGDDAQALEPLLVAQGLQTGKPVADPSTFYADQLQAMATPGGTHMGLADVGRALFAGDPTWTTLLTGTPEAPLTPQEQVGMVQYLVSSATPYMPKPLADSVNTILTTQGKAYETAVLRGQFQGTYIDWLRANGIDQQIFGG
ncbi:MAG TPA: hypothetical protein VFU21_07875 [Kofleriaceae bacterium]|nr:hypothetical protein [Kofleriaceae bacterium]